MLAEAVRVTRPGGLIAGYDLTDTAVARVVHRLDGSEFRLLGAAELERELVRLGTTARVERALAGSDDAVPGTGRVSGYRLTVRTGAKVAKHRHERMDEALAELRRVGQELADTAGSRAVGGRLMRRFEPVQQVIGRVELRGPGVRCGVDVRGDGSTEAFTGRAAARAGTPAAGRVPLRRAGPRAGGITPS